MTINLAEGIAIVVVLNSVPSVITLFVEGGPTYDRLGSDSSDPANSIGLGIGHS